MGPTYSRKRKFISPITELTLKFIISNKNCKVSKIYASEAKMFSF